MKRLYPLPLSLPFLFPCYFSSADVKKTKTPQVYFSASSATVNANGTATVTVTLSQASDNVVEVGFQSIGTSKIDFGTTATSFMHDDSDKMQAQIDASGGISIQWGATSNNAGGHRRCYFRFVQKADNYAHAASNFEIKMVSAQNATIRQGSDT